MIRATRKLTVAQPKDQKGYTVVESDWRRLKRLVERVVPSTRVFQVLGSMVAGMAITALCTWVGLLASTDSPPWVKPVVLEATAALVVIALLMFIADSREKTHVQSSSQTILEEMALIEASCEEEEELQSASPEAARSTPEDQSAVPFVPGMRVRHPQFGIGIVQRVVSMGGDHKLTVTFASVGQKKMLGSWIRRYATLDTSPAQPPNRTTP